MSSLHHAASVDHLDRLICEHTSLRLGRNMPTNSRSRGLPAFPISRETAKCNSGYDFCLKSVGTQKQNLSRQKTSSCQLTDVWTAGSTWDCHAQDVCQWSPSRLNFDMEASVVYRDLFEAMQRLEFPGWNGCLLRSEKTSIAQLLVGDGVSSPSVDIENFKASSGPRSRPMSLSMLKRKRSFQCTTKPCKSLSRDPSEKLSCCPQDGYKSSEHGDDSALNMAGAVNTAFSSLVLMMESLQRQTLRLRTTLSMEEDMCLNMRMETVHQENQETFLSLFQKVFACTPNLMVFIMLFLVDFTTYAIEKNISLTVMPLGEPPTARQRLNPWATSTINGQDDALGVEKMHYQNFYLDCSQVSPNLLFCEGEEGNSVAKNVKVGKGIDGESDQSPHNGFRIDEGQHALETIWRQVVPNKLNSFALGKTKHMLVAPVSAPALENDNYVCYDRTDLKYQDQLSKDPENPLLLANYAHFLHVVRHDYKRAEMMYQRAIRSDPADGESIGMYARFLWVAKEDVEAADEAFKAAISTDPSSAYHVANYAHFLWSSRAE
ncbi:hypothetical protein KP509_11G090000 [Ceratopteris richardii]|uniref:Uncharacterized protein n=1 Tax=Ceratopteris richardii TaxID=49495 RepID=A0A8T2TS43_CERRI|nr:hypothetical protein KP509_11G090000 [Ceratopteris richardii]